MVLKWNKSVSLVSHGDEGRLIEDHVKDSLLGASEAKITEDNAVADIGSGNGFPAIPIKILFPRIRITMVESNTRKASFLREVLRELNLKGEVAAERVEKFDFSAFDTITSRAFKPIEEIREIIREGNFKGRIIVWEKRSSGRISSYEYNK